MVTTTRRAELKLGKLPARVDPARSRSRGTSTGRCSPRRRRSSTWPRAVRRVADVRERPDRRLHDAPPPAT